MRSTIRRQSTLSRDPKGSALTTIVTLCIVVAVSTTAALADKAVCPVTADVGVTSVVEKMGFSNGVGPTTSIMQNQNWSGFENMDLLMAFDTKAIKGWTVSSATMHVTLAKGDLYGIGLCTVLSEWSEGDALNWAPKAGAPCWNYRATPPEGAKPGPEHLWAWPGSLFHTVCWSHPAARYSHAGNAAIKRTKTEDGRFVKLSFPVDPKLVEALAAGVAHGLVLTDDKGQVRESYSLLGPAYPYLYNAAEDIWVFTRDISVENLRPYLEIVGEAKDKTPPGECKDLKAVEVSPTGGTFVVTFTAPGDDGATGEVLSYDVMANGKPLPRWAIAAPVAAGKTQRMPVFTLPAGKHELEICGVDEAGNRGVAGKITVDLPAAPKAGFEPGVGSRPGQPLRRHGQEDKLDVGIVPDTVKVDPVSGAVQTDTPGYAPAGKFLAENGIWLRPTLQAFFIAAANETVAFQVILQAKQKTLTDISVKVGDLKAAKGDAVIKADPNVELFRVWYVATVSEKKEAVGPGELDKPVSVASGFQGEVCLPMKAPFGETFAIPAADNAVPNQQYQSVWVDLYVPRGTPAGSYSGKITVTAKELTKPVELSLTLTVRPFELPDEPTFITELNRYNTVAGWAGVDWKDADRARKVTWDYYRLAHAHRCTLNVLPYTHSSRMDAEYLPKMSGEGTETRVADWADYDKLFGPLLDGSAFSAKNGYVGPGEGVPLAHMYMPFHEGWPIPVNKDTYADWKECNTREDFAEYAKVARRPQEAFTEAYKKAHSAVAGQFFDHFAQRGWTRTQMHFYNNNKYYWKVAYFGGMGRGGVSFWLMDEPSDFDDYDANGFIMSLGLAGRAVAGAEAAKVRAVGRTDVSQADMARGLWDNVAGVWCIGGFRGFHPTAAVRKLWLPEEDHWAYGGGQGVDDPPVVLARSFLKRWSAGAAGFMPWWNCFGGQGGAWKKADDLAIYYAGRGSAGGKVNTDQPLASVRMKLARRGAQDVEYLNLLAKRPGWDFHRVRSAVAALADDRDAPVLEFEKLPFDRAESLRESVAATIEKNR